MELVFSFILLFCAPSEPSMRTRRVHYCLKRPKQSRLLQIEQNDKLTRNSSYELLILCLGGFRFCIPLSWTSTDPRSLSWVRDAIWEWTNATKTTLLLFWGFFGCRLPALCVPSSWRNVDWWTLNFRRRIGRCDRKEKVSAFPRPPCSAGEIPFHSTATFTPLTPSITDQCIYTPKDSFFSYSYKSSSFFPPYFALYVPELTKVVLTVYFSCFWVIELSGRCKI